MGSDARDVREHLLVDVEVVDGLSSLPTNVKLRVQNLTRQSETGQTILSRVNLDIPAGLIVGIIGPSGSGKSTLLRALNRMWEPSESTVFLDNQDICQLDVLSLRRRVGMLFQLPALFTDVNPLVLEITPKNDGCYVYTRESTADIFALFMPCLLMTTVALEAELNVKFPVLNSGKTTESWNDKMACISGLAGTVADNIQYGPRLRGKKLTDIEVQKLLSVADLDPSLASRTASDLSVGQAQRVALARSLANDPEVLLLDEPTSALDPISTRNIEEAMLHLKKSQQMTMVMVSHSIKQIQRIADLVCLLVDGEVVEVLHPLLPLPSKASDGSSFSSSFASHLLVTFDYLASIRVD